MRNEYRKKFPRNDGERLLGKKRPAEDQIENSEETSGATNDFALQNKRFKDNDGRKINFRGGFRGRGGRGRGRGGNDRGAPRENDRGEFRGGRGGSGNPSQNNSGYLGNRGNIGNSYQGGGQYYPQGEEEMEQQHGQMYFDDRNKKMDNQMKFQQRENDDIEIVFREVEKKIDNANRMKLDFCSAKYMEQLKKCYFCISNFFR
mgnify:CR=1 FL=1